MSEDTVEKKKLDLGPFTTPENSVKELESMATELSQAALNSSTESFAELAQQLVTDAYELGVSDKKIDVTQRIHSEISVAIFKKLEEELTKQYKTESETSKDEAEKA